MTYLIDTNLLVYLHTHTDSKKRQRAVEVVRLLSATNSAVLSAQVLAELANVSIRKLGLQVPDVQGQVTQLAKAFPVLPLTEWVVINALQAVKEHQLSYYDAQIWAAAQTHRVPYILSEDFKAGSTLGGVTFLDPFADGFEVAALA